MHHLSKKEPFKKYTVECSDNHKTVICTNSLGTPTVKLFRTFISRIIANETGAVLFTKQIN